MTGYKVVIYYQGKEIVLENTEAITAVIDGLANKAFRGFQVVFLSTSDPVGSPNFFDQSDWLSLPMQLDTYVTTDIYTNTSFEYDGSIQLETPAYADPASFRYNPELLNGFSPIQVVYSLKMASGQNVTSPIVACWYAKE